MAEALSPQVLSTLIGSIYHCALAPNRWEGDTRREFIGAVPDERDDSNAMAAAYGLTPAETRVLASLLAGQTPAEIAVGLGIAATTGKDSSQEHLPEDRRLPPGRPDPVLDTGDPACEAGGALKAGANSPKCLAVLAASFSGCGAEDSFQALEKRRPDVDSRLFAS